MPEPGTADERPALKPFGQFVQEQRRGSLHTELSEQLADLVHACTETGKKGKLTLHVVVAPMKGEDGVVTVTDEVRVVAPRPDARPAIFFADEHGNLSRNDPRQMDMGLRGVDGGRADDGDDESRGRTAGSAS